MKTSPRKENTFVKLRIILINMFCTFPLCQALCCELGKQE